MGWLALPFLSLSYLLFLQAECGSTSLWFVIATLSQVNTSPGTQPQRHAPVLEYIRGKVMCGPGVLPAHSYCTECNYLWCVGYTTGLMRQVRGQPTGRGFFLPPRRSQVWLGHLGGSSRPLDALNHCTHACTCELCISSERPKQTSQQMQLQWWINVRNSRF